MSSIIFKNGFDISQTLQMLKPKIMCLDIGLFKTGIAASSTCLKFAQQIGVCKTDFATINQYFTNLNCKTLVVGCPFVASNDIFNANESPEINVIKKIDEIAKSFATTHKGIAVIYVNENFSSDNVKATYGNKKKLRGLDAAVATYLLQDFLIQAGF